jgi:hypothetical protein
MIVEIEFQRMNIYDFQLCIAVWAGDDLACHGIVIQIDRILAIQTRHGDQLFWSYHSFASFRAGQLRTALHCGFIGAEVTIGGLIHTTSKPEQQWGHASRQPTTVPGFRRIW